MKTLIQAILPTKHVKTGNYRPASETPSEWRYTGGPIVARDGREAPQAQEQPRLSRDTDNGKKMLTHLSRDTANTCMWPQ